MLCCVGLFVGVAVGQYLGGPWTFIAPIIGFGAGFVGDMKLMGHKHGGGCTEHGTHGDKEQTNQKTEDKKSNKKSETEKCH
jgi:hypothetical protein